MNKFKIASLLTALFTLTACGSGSDDTSATGTLSISLTDTPVDEASHVYVTIRGVALNFQEEGWVDHDLDSPVKIDLLTLQGGNTLSLLNDLELAAGEYSIRLNLYSDDDNVLDQSIVLEDGGNEYELTVPSGEQTGLKLSSTVTVPSEGVANYTIDFDVRRSVVQRGVNLEFNLKPVLRLVNNADMGSISGSFTDPTLFSTDCSDSDPLTYNVVYVYEGHDMMPDDIGSSGAEPISTASVTLNESTGEYEYTATFLPTGDYTVALTCNSDLEDIEEDDELLFKEVTNRTAS